MTLPAPRVTVIVPVHNSSFHLGALFMRLDASVAAHFQVILVDDGSTDGSVEMLQSYASDHASVELIVLPLRQGVAYARNTALRAARGKYVWFVDDDDLWAADALTRLLDAADRSRASLIVCRAELREHVASPGPVIDGIDDDLVVDKSSAWQMLLDGVVNGYLWNKLFERSTLGIDPFASLSSQSDFTGVARAVAASETVHFIPDVLYFHLVRQGSITRRRDPKLENLQAAYEVATSLHTTIMRRHFDSSIEHFRAWFLIVPFGNTPTRVRASWSLRCEGIRRARDAARGIDMRRLRLRSPRVHRVVWAITRLGLLYLAILQGVQGGRRVMRKVGLK